VSRPRSPEPVLMVLGLLHEPHFPLADLRDQLHKRFGDWDEATAPLPFLWTDYYRPEMGAELQRRFLAMTELIEPGRLTEVKLATNEVEESWLNDKGGRRVNLDTGILSLHNFILATGKNYSHRVYLGQGIFADLPLMWTRGGWLELPWTFPDYRDRRIQDVLTGFRETYRRRLTAWREAQEKS